MKQFIQLRIRKLLTGLALAAACLAAGCASDDDPGQTSGWASKITLTFTEYFNDEGGKTLNTWTEGDKAGVFVLGDVSSEKYYAAPIQTKSPKSLFLFTLDLPKHHDTTLVGFYPADADITCENGLLKTTIPATQTGAVEPLLLGTATGRINSYEGHDIVLKPFYSTLYIPVRGSQAIARAVVKAKGGEALAGEITLDPQDMAAEATEHTVTVDFPAPLDCSAQTKSIPVMLAPVALAEGYEVTLTDTDGNSFSVSTDEPTELSAGGKVESREAVSPYLVKVLSFNIRVDNPVDGSHVWANRRQAVRTMIGRELPTVMGLQEAQAHQITYLARQFPDYAWYGLGRDTGEVPPATDTYASEECMAIFYRTAEVELLDKGTFWLSETPEIPSKGWDADYKRSCTWALFEQKATGKRFYHFNMHLDNKGATARRESIKLIVGEIARINSAGLPVFLTADFNSDTDDGSFNPLHQAMKDARATAPITDQKATYNGYKPNGTRRLDHIFYSSPSVADTFRTLTEDYGAPYISDHYPIRADFALR